MKKKDLKKILIVEDELHIRETLQDILMVAGYNVVTAEDGEKGFFTAMRELPDLILSDVMMPKMDGYSFLEAVRAYEKTKFTPFILLTAKSATEYFREGMSMGADDYIIKPFDHTELLMSIQYRLQRRLEFEDEVKQNELQRMRMDLHDNLQQTLLGAKMIIEAIRKKYGLKDDLLDDELNEALINLDLSFLHLRNMLDDNPKSNLSLLGFRKTLHRMVKSFERFTRITTVLNYDWNLEPPIYVGEELIPAISEILTNVVKHAHARNIVISIHKNDDGCTVLDIADDGKGMLLTEPKNAGHGIANIHSRIMKVGSYELISAPGEGTKYVITLHDHAPH